MTPTELQHNFFRLAGRIYQCDRAFARLHRLWQQGAIKVPKTDIFYALNRVGLSFILLVELFRQRGEPARFVRRTLTFMWMRRGVNLGALLYNLNFLQMAHRLQRFLGKES